MKKIISIIILLAISKIAGSQEIASLTGLKGYTPASNSTFYTSKRSENAISPFALSFNPIGFAQFGPIVNAEFGLTGNLVLNTHIRFSFLGLCTYLVYDWPDEYSGIAAGGGMLYFFGKRKGKPYVGMLIEYDKAHTLFDRGGSDEWEKTNNTVVFICNGGYRFRFGGGFFMNTGMFLGAYTSHYKWNYTGDSDFEEGDEIKPFGMIEFTLGFEF